MAENTGIDIMQDDDLEDEALDRSDGVFGGKLQCIGGCWGK
ncbi:MAG: hypothetical protein O3A96_07330 [Proteobacteria bacterium]|nr:hypothetical protein [Pseudomonadota bacterium]